MGYTSGISFNTGVADTFSVSTVTQLNYTNASICDNNGNLLFFTNGAAIFNRNSDTLVNGDNLNPCSFTTTYSFALPLSQADIIIQRPNHPEQYYLFHETMDNNADLLVNTLYMTVVDMTLDSGRGAVTSVKNFHLYSNDTLITGLLSATRHANGRDWWLVTRKDINSVFYKWLITPDSVMGPYVQNNIQGVGFIYYKGAGQTCFSPDGEKYACMYASKYLYLYDFDRCTGDLTFAYNEFLNDSSSWATGCAFSASGHYLYVANNYIIYQYDMYAANLYASKTIVAVYDGFASPQLPSRTLFNQMKLAPDGKIYICTSNGCDVLHVIESPDSAGLTCNVLQHSFYLSPTVGGTCSLPNIPDYNLGAQDPPCDSTNVIPELSNSNFKLQAYPNPTNGTLTLKFHSKIAILYELSITDISGRLLIGKDGRAFKGINLKEMDLTGLAKGFYFINLSSSEINETIRVTIE